MQALGVAENFSVAKRTVLPHACRTQSPAWSWLRRHHNGQALRLLAHDMAAALDSGLAALAATHAALAGSPSQAATTQPVSAGPTMGPDSAPAGLGAARLAPLQRSLMGAMAFPPGALRTPGTALAATTSTYKSSRGVGLTRVVAPVQSLAFLPQLPSPSDDADVQAAAAGGLHQGPDSAIAALVHAGGARMLLLAQVRMAGQACQHVLQ